MSGLHTLQAQQIRGQVMENNLILGKNNFLFDDLKDWKAEESLTVSLLEGNNVADFAICVRGLCLVDDLGGSRPDASVNLTGVTVFEALLGSLAPNTQASLGRGYSKQTYADEKPLTGQYTGKYPMGSSSGWASNMDLDA